MKEAGLEQGLRYSRGLRQESGKFKFSLGYDQESMGWRVQLVWKTALVMSLGAEGLGFHPRTRGKDGGGVSECPETDKESMDYL